MNTSTTTGLTKGGQTWVPEFIAGINQENCIGCGRCYKACGRNVFELVEFMEDDDMLSQRMSVGNADDCIGCGACVRVCMKKCPNLQT